MGLWDDGLVVNARLNVYCSRATAGPDIRRVRRIGRGK